MLFQALVVVELVDLETDFGIFVREERSNTGMGGAESGLAETLLLVAVKVDMVGHDELSALRDQDFRFRNTGVGDLFDFLQETVSINCHAVAQDVDRARVADSGRKGVERKASVVVDNRMARVGTALKANDDVCVLGKHIGDLTFALVAPVCAYDCFYHEWHLRNGN